jgi:hypothetical protein
MVLPALPAYPARPEISWQAGAESVALPFADAIQLRDWLVQEQAWKEAIEEIWTIFQP